MGESSKSALIRVVAALICREHRYLVARRPAHKHHGGLWEFPGGKIEHGETIAAALARELDEELGLELLRHGDVHYVDRQPGERVVIEFVEATVRGEPQMFEHSAIAWPTIDELGALDLAPADARCVNALRALSRR